MKLTTLGLRHLALIVKNLEACEKFYTQLLGMKVDWHPDADNIYLTSGHDNLALHRAPADFAPGASQYLDHLGFMLKSKEDVSAWYEHLKSHNVKIRFPLKDHRDGSTSFYCYDPEGNTVQFMYHPHCTQ